MTIKKKLEKEVVKKSNKSGALKKRKMMAARMETSIMNNTKSLPTSITKSSSNKGTISEEKNVGCCQKFFDMLGLGSSHMERNDENI